MRVVVVGATGNVGTSLLKALSTEERVTEIVGIARRLPSLQMEKTVWVRADIASDDLVPHFKGADAVVHLGWLIQPSRDEGQLYRVNVEGSRRVFEAAAVAGVDSIIYASSVGTYSPGPKSTPVDERWPTEGIPTSFYSRHKAAVERMLDGFEVDHPSIRVVRLRPALIFKREAATGIRRLFFGPLIPGWLVDPRRLPFVPRISRLVFQTVHSEDVAEAYRLALLGDVRGAFNVAADPVIDPDVLASALGGRAIPLPARLVRLLMNLSWKAHIQPSPPGWIDMGRETPVMDTSKALVQLGWKPRHQGTETLVELLEGFADGASFDTPPLARSTTAPFRWRELATGIGDR